MYAIIRDGQHQYKVEEGQELNVDYRDASQGDEVTFEVLCISGDDGVTLGKPAISGAAVKAEVLGVKQGKKIVVQKFRRRKNSRSKMGHRQLYTRVRVNAIEST